MKYIIGLHFALIMYLISCGPPCNVTVQRGGGTEVNLAFFQASCATAGCHLNDGRSVTEALKTDATFKAYQPALARILNKSMPLGKPFDDATIEKVKVYFSKGVLDGQGKDDAGE